MKDYSIKSVLRALGWGALLGGGAGLTAGLLLAPENGRRMRRRISYRLENLARRAGTLFDQVMTPEQDGEARRHGEELVADARKQAQLIQTEIDAVLGQVRQQGETPSGDD